MLYTDGFVHFAITLFMSYSSSLAWCLRNEGVSSVLLGTSNAEQLTENLGAIQVSITEIKLISSTKTLDSFSILPICCTFRYFQR